VCGMFECNELRNFGLRNERNDIGEIPGGGNPPRRTGISQLIGGLKRVGAARCLEHHAVLLVRDVRRYRCARSQRAVSRRPRFQRPKEHQIDKVGMLTQRLCAYQ
jgi:hypothetical protein